MIIIVIIVIINMEYLRNLSNEHEKLKKRIHSYRLPLSPTGIDVLPLYIVIVL